MDHDQVFAVKSLRVYEQDPVDKINKVRCPSIRKSIDGLLIVLCLEILQRSYSLQASEPSKYPVDRRRGAKVVRVLHGVSVDAEWKYPGICGKVPRSQSLATGNSTALAI
jgi:hypothetical protein